jgi:HB1/ASXL restriction endonuclease-like protein with HTH domain
MVALEELKDIIVGLDQRISVYKSRLQDLQKKREKIDDEIATIKKYLELAETLYRVEVDKTKLASLSSQIVTDSDKDKAPLRAPVLVDVTDQSREILLGRSKYVGMSVSEAAFEILRDARSAMHAKEICHRLIEGGLRIKGKTPVTSIATSLKRDRRFRKVAPNTFEAVEEKLQAV